MSEPIQKRYKNKMNELAQFLDWNFNGNAKGEDRKVGFVMLIFPFGNADRQRINYISNAERKDMVIALKEIVARFEGQPEMKGRA